VPGLGTLPEVAPLLLLLLVPAMRRCHFQSGTSPLAAPTASPSKSVTVVIQSAGLLLLELLLAVTEVSAGTVCTARALRRTLTVNLQQTRNHLHGRDDLLPVPIAVAKILTSPRWCRHCGVCRFKPHVATRFKATHCASVFSRSALTLLAAALREAEHRAHAKGERSRERPALRAT